jgi:hypothetical protein
MKKQIHLIILFGLLILLTVKESQGQVFICGNEIDSQQESFESTFTPAGKLKKLERNISIHTYLVRDKDGNTNFSQTDLNDAITYLNRVFDSIKVTFNNTTIHYIDNYNYNSLNIQTTLQQLCNEFYTRNVINLYLVNELEVAGETIHGLSSWPSDDKTYIVMNKNRVTGPALTHLSGHVFGLYHTHETDFGTEKADGSNCETAGDLCCDTYGDPNIRGLVSPSCQYTGNRIDSEGNAYHPGTRNFMSYTQQHCMCYFSMCQYIRMINILEGTKQNLW